MIVRLSEFIFKIAKKLSLNKNGKGKLKRLRKIGHVLGHDRCDSS